MVFKKTSTTNINLTLKMDHLVIDRVDYFNFLGLTIDSQMTWKNHTNNISNKCVRVIGILTQYTVFIAIARLIGTLPFTYKVPKQIRDPRFVRGMPSYSLNRKTMFH